MKFMKISKFKISSCISGHSA